MSRKCSLEENFNLFFPEIHFRTISYFLKYSKVLQGTRIYSTIFHMWYIPWLPKKSFIWNPYVVHFKNAKNKIKNNKNKKTLLLWDSELFCKYHINTHARYRSRISLNFSDLQYISSETNRNRYNTKRTATQQIYCHQTLLITTKLQDICMTV